MESNALTVFEHKSQLDYSGPISTPAVYKPGYKGVHGASSWGGQGSAGSAVSDLDAVSARSAVSADSKLSVCADFRFFRLRLGTTRSSLDRSRP
jgi:hypothetical protein